MSCHLRHWLGVAVSCLGLAAVQAASVENGSFELNRFTVHPGYASANGGSIFGWTFTGNAGLNRAGEPFADNGKVPDGVNVAFVQNGATLSTTITGLTPGKPHVLQFRTNRRAGTGEPVATYSLGGGAPVGFVVSPAVGPTNAYRTVKIPFTPSQASLAFEFRNQSTGDSAFLVDDVRVHLPTVSAGMGSGAEPLTSSPAVAMTWMICKNGIFPTPGTTSDPNDEPYVGEVRLFASPSAHMGQSGAWLPCDGRELQISQNAAMFYLLSTVHGGNGQTTFRIPDLRGHVPMGAGAGPGLVPRSVGDYGSGTKLTVANLPPHRHTLANGRTTEEEGGGQPLACLPPFRVLQPFVIDAGDPNATAAVRWFAGTVNVPGLPCDGALLDASGHPALFEQFGYTFGGSDGQFRVPDLRGRIVIGQGAGNGLSPRTLGASGGTDSGVTLPASALPAHSHGLPSGAEGATGVAGAGSPFSAMPPFVVLNPQVARNGIYQHSFRTPAVGEVRWFAASSEQVESFGGYTWLPCNGGSVEIAQESTYASAVTDVWGGGATNRLLPDLRGRMAVGEGQSGTLPNRTLAASFGSESYQLTAAMLPAHLHAVDTSTTTSLTRHFAWNEEPPISLMTQVKGAFSVPTGTVGLWEGDTLLQSRALEPDGTAIFPDVALSPGGHVLHVRYSGEGTFTGSRSPDYVHHSNGWSVQSWRDDDESGISTRTSWAYRFNSTTSAIIGGKIVSRVAGTNPLATGHFSTFGMNLLHAGDTNALTAAAGTGSAEIAKSFVYNGNPGMIGLQGLTPGKRYVLTLLSVGFDPSGSRRSTFSSGGNSMVVEQGRYGNDEGIRVDYVFTPGDTIHTITLTPEDAGRSFHLYAMALRSATIVDPAYAAWASTKGLGGGNETYEADPNHNGIPNAIEFVLGGEPALQGAMPDLPEVALSWNDVVFTFKRMDAAAGLNPRVEFSTSLTGPWTTAVDGANATIRVDDWYLTDTVTVFIPRNGADKMFVRLRTRQ